MSAEGSRAAPPAKRVRIVMTMRKKRHPQSPGQKADPSGPTSSKPRKRGRPKKNTDAIASPPRKRGRPKKVAADSPPGQPKKRGGPKKNTNKGPSTKTKGKKGTAKGTKSATTSKKKEVTSRQTEATKPKKGSSSGSSEPSPTQRKAQQPELASKNPLSGPGFGPSDPLPLPLAPFANLLLTCSCCPKRYVPVHNGFCR
jgi:hypothetical protein